MADFKIAFEFAGRRVERTLDAQGTISIPPGVDVNEALSLAMKVRFFEIIEKGELNSMLTELLQ